MKKKIISAVLSVVIVLSAFIIVPMTREVQAEAAYDPSLGMYSRLSNVFTGAELSELVYARNEMSYSYDSSSEYALKLTLTAFSDPYIYFDLSSASIDLSVYTKLVVIYKMPLTNKQEWQRMQYFWWNTANSMAQSDEYSSDYSYYRNGAYYYDVKSNNLTTGTLKHFRMDTSSWAAFWQTGDCIYIDSIAFFKTDAEALAYRQERMSVRNKEGDTYSITPSQFAADNAFSGAHNVAVSYTASYGGAFKLTTTPNCSNINGTNGLSTACNGTYYCWNHNTYATYANNAAFGADPWDTVFDPYITLNCNVDTSKYKYAVIMYMPDYNDHTNIAAGCGLLKAGGHYESRTETRHYVRFVTNFNSGSSIEKQFTTLGANEMFYEIVDLSGYSGQSLTSFRIDPIDYTFSKVNRSIYLKSIVFTTTAEAADASAKSMLQSTGMYTYQLSYNGNATGVSGVPGSTGLITTQNATQTYNLSSSAPTAPNVIFDGWTYNGNIYQPGQSVTVSGTVNTITTATLTGMWHYPYGTMNITVSNGSQNIDPNQTYLFRIQGTGADPAIGAFDILIPLTTGQSMSFSLPYGTYTITCVDGWSWRYGLDNLSRTVTINTENQTYSQNFDFTSGKNESWLNKYYDTIIS